MISSGGSTTSASPALGSQASAKAPDPESAPAGSALVAKTSTDAPLQLDQNARQLSAADNAISGEVQGTVDLAPFAELSLARTVAPASPIQVLDPKHDAPPPSSSSSSSPGGLQADAGAGSKSQPAAGEATVPEIRVSSIGHESGSSLDQPASQQKVDVTASKKKVEAGSVRSEDAAVPPDRGMNAQSEAASSIATRPAGAQRSRMPDESPAPASPVLEPVATEPAKPFGSSVGSIELTVKISGEEQVGLRFAEKQGRVEIQLKSSDAQTAKALSDNLAGLKTSLNEGGWDVESRVQDRPAGLDQGSQTGVSSEKSPSTQAQFESSGLAARAPLTSSSTPVDHLGSPPPPRPEQISSGQMSRQSGSDPSAGQDHSRPDRDGSSGRDGQPARDDSARGDSERQGRRSGRDSEVWLESMESNLTGRKYSRFTSGVIK